uniref:Uncharacterized protein n=1 Tax=Escherichia coli TaxID=562 RepID=A0A7U1HS18_ECOLX|nr:hypothetical protein [Escherichia coli]
MRGYYVFCSTMKKYGICSSCSGIASGRIFWIGLFISRVTMDYRAKDCVCQISVSEIRRGRGIYC